MLRRLLAAVPAVLLAELAACAHTRTVTTWKPLPVSPETLAAQRPKEVRVTRTDHSTKLLYQPELVADTLRGYGNLPASPLWLVRVPVSDIQALEVQRTERDTLTVAEMSERNTKVLLGGGIAAALFVLFLVTYPHRQGW